MDDRKMIEKTPYHYVISRPSIRFELQSDIENMPEPIIILMGWNNSVNFSTHPKNKQFCKIRIANLSTV